jgi:hypothetical protein
MQPKRFFFSRPFFCDLIPESISFRLETHNLRYEVIKSSSVQGRAKCNFLRPEMFEWNRKQELYSIQECLESLTSVDESFESREPDREREYFPSVVESDRPARLYQCTFRRCCVVAKNIPLEALEFQLKLIQQPIRRFEKAILERLQ